MKSLTQVYQDVAAWCDGGPTPDRDEVLLAFHNLIQAAASANQVELPQDPDSLDPAVWAPNVEAFDVRFKDPKFVQDLGKAAVKQALARGLEGRP